MAPFNLTAPFEPTGDQPEAIAALMQGLAAGLPFQTLLGVTGSGKTFTSANVIAQYGKPALILSHNKTLAAQLYEELRRFFPDNAVQYFVSYYDYYQPEAYIPQSDTYIQKDASTNEELDRLRHATVQALLTRNDVIVVASVSAIYGIGSPENYKALAVSLARDAKLSLRGLVEQLTDLQYDRNDTDPVPGSFRIRGNEVVIVPPTGTGSVIVRIAENRITDMLERGVGLTDPEKPIAKTTIFPGRFWVSPEEQIEPALVLIEHELEERLHELTAQGKLLEADRLGQRARADIALMRETGMCHGIENYSRHLDGREPGTPPFTLVDYFNHTYGKDEWLLVVDESHQTLPQVRGMVRGDNARKDVLIEHGFRLPSAKDNRPLTFEEFFDRIGPTIFQSATPANFELEISQRIANSESPVAPKGSGSSESYSPSAIRHQPRILKGFVEQLVRPTGLLDPTIEVRHTEGQLPYLVEQIEARITKGQRVLITTLTKRLAEELTAWLRDHDIKVEYLHSDVKTLERPEILHKLRSGEVDVVVGINLLREGLDLPEVSLIGILDADQEGFLRDETSLVQVMGRAARHTEGHVILFADRMTKSMRRAIEETTRRREHQAAYNRAHGITPVGTVRSMEQPSLVGQRKPENLDATTMNPQAVKELRRAMKKAAENLDFEKAARIRDALKKLSRE